MAHPVMKLIDMLVNRPGWTFCGMYQDPPSPPPGFTLETKEDGFLGFVTHYRFVRASVEADKIPDVLLGAVANEGPVQDSLVLVAQDYRQVLRPANQETARHFQVVVPTLEICVDGFSVALNDLLAGGSEVSVDLNSGPSQQEQEICGELRRAPGQLVDPFLQTVKRPFCFGLVSAGDEENCNMAKRCGDPAQRCSVLLLFGLCSFDPACPTFKRTVQQDESTRSHCHQACKKGLISLYPFQHDQIAPPVQKGVSDTLFPAIASVPFNYVADQPNAECDPRVTSAVLPSPLHFALQLDRSQVRASDSVKRAAP